MLVPTSLLLQQDSVTPGGPRVLGMSPGRPCFLLCRWAELVPAASAAPGPQSRHSCRPQWGFVGGQTLAFWDSRVLRPGTLLGCGREAELCPAVGGSAHRPQSNWDGAWDPRGLRLRD